MHQSYRDVQSESRGCSAVGLGSGVCTGPSGWGGFASVVRWEGPLQVEGMEGIVCASRSEGV